MDSNERPGTEEQANDAEIAFRSRRSGAPQRSRRERAALLAKALKKPTSVLSHDLSGPWLVSEAKAHLSRIMDSCRDGRLVLIGQKKRTVVMMSLDDAERLAAQREGSRSWADVLMADAQAKVPADTLRMPPEMPASTPVFDPEKLSPR